MYVEKKKINGKIYNYLKVSARVSNKVKTKTLAYLGKEPMTKKELQQKISKIPKTKIKKMIEELKGTASLRFLTNEQLNKLNLIKKEFQNKLKQLDKKLIADMFKDFKTYYIYNTNAIEGNTLTLEETGRLLNENITPEGNDLKEIYDHINERDVFDKLLEEKTEINLQQIIDIHAQLLKNIDNRTGNFRRHNVRVIGANFNTTQAKYVLTDMKILIKWYNKNKKNLHPLVIAVIFHEKFERIHPFYDGNGRTGRMLLNLILIKSKLPPLIIKNKDRKEYYKVLDKGHQADLTSIEQEHYQPIIGFCYDLLIETYVKIFAKWG
jgi:Fic family protein